MSRIASSLPQILSVTSAIVTYDTPVVYYERGRRIEKTQVAHIDIQTSEALPARALTPLVLVGNVAVRDYIPLDEKRYRFISYEPENLQFGATIALAWFEGDNAPRQESNFRYQPNKDTPLVT